MTPPIEIARPRGQLPISSTVFASSGSTSSSDSTATVSTPGQLQSALLNLQVTQPQQVQSSLSDVASGLTSAANAAGVSSPHGQVLSAAADKVQQAAVTGNVSRLASSASTNKVQEKYAPSQAYGSGSVLELLASATNLATSTKSSSSQPSTIVHSSSAASNDVSQILSEVLKQLQNTLSG
jgi:hypothetical protein